ncbi:MAG: transporter substrate-binding domain-containing protein [Bacteroidales bacterium]|nr:transporter substrate-binding domain-containing protein [Bacteroidales bacterium]
MEKTKPILLIALLIAGCMFILYSCLSDHEKKQSDIQDDDNLLHHDHSLQRILDRDTLVALIDYNSTNYFIYRGEPMGYQFEMLQQFADFLDVNLKLVISNDMYQAFDLLNDDKVDLIAMGLTVTRDRQKIVDFTIPQIQTKQVLVQRKPENWRKMRTWDEIEDQLIRNPLELAGMEVHVQKGTVFANRLAILANEIGDTIHIVEDPKREVEQLITAVAEGEIEFTISDEHIAKVNQKYYPNIDVSTALSFPQHVAWAVRQGNDSLRLEINGWIMDYKKSVASRYIYNKYFNNPRSVNIAQSEYHSIGGGKISQYDEIIRKFSASYGLDWRLVASLIYQESRFHPEVTSWVGAFGLMQLMPTTADIYGVDTNSPPAEQIRAGIEFLRWLDQQLPPEIENPEERIRFVIAAYNVGIAHIYDARRLAEKHDKDPNVWTENVDFFILNKSNPAYYRDSVVKYGYARGEETYNFVVEIFERYEHYKKVIEN